MWPTAQRQRKRPGEHRPLLRFEWLTRQKFRRHASLTRDIAKYSGVFAPSAPPWHRTGEIGRANGSGARARTRCFAVELRVVAGLGARHVTSGITHIALLCSDLVAANGGVPVDDPFEMPRVVAAARDADAAMPTSVTTPRPVPLRGSTSTRARGRTGRRGQESNGSVKSVTVGAPLARRPSAAVWRLDFAAPRWPVQGTADDHQGAVHHQVGECFPPSVAVRSL